MRYASFLFLLLIGCGGAPFTSLSDGETSVPDGGHGGESVDAGRLESGSPWTTQFGGSGVGYGGEGGSAGDSGDSSTSTISSSSGASSCSPANCPYCCDDSGRCQPGTADSACGLPGTKCVVCAPTCGFGPCAFGGLTYHTCQAGACVVSGGGCCPDSPGWYCNVADGACEYQ